MDANPGQPALRPPAEPLASMPTPMKNSPLPTNIVWAPDAKEVWINLNGARQRLRKAQNGWWTAEQPLAHGDQYSFDIDENSNLPDPRSPFLPSGVAGPSQHVDHAAFAWNDAAWQPSP